MAEPESVMPQIGGMTMVEDDAVIDEIMTWIHRKFIVSTTAPNSSTPAVEGTICIKLGATATSANTIYVKRRGEWWGG